MSSEEILATGVMALYHHVKGDWTPVKGDATSKSNIALVKGKTGSYTIKVNFASTNELLLSSVLSTSSSVQLQAGYDTFYLYYDGKVYWGLWFSDATVASIFCEKVTAAAKSLSTDAGRGKVSMSTTSSTANKFKASSGTGAGPEDSGTPTRAGSAPGNKKMATTTPDSSTAARSVTHPSKIGSTVSEAVLSKPSTPISNAKMTSTVSEAVLGRNGSPSSALSTSKDVPTTSGIGKLQRPGFSTPQTMSSSATSTAPGSAPSSSAAAPGVSGLKKLDIAAATSSAPSSPGLHSSDDSLQSSPSSKSLKRPDSARKKSTTTTLVASGDSHVPEKTEEKKNKTQREKIIDEVLKTEEDYVDSLSLVRDKYLIPLKYAPRLGISIFRPGDLEKIMYGIEPIFVLNSALLGDLKLRKHDKTVYDQCGYILSRYAPSMKLYIDYVNKYENTIRTIKEYAESSPLFKQFLVATSEDPESSARSIYDFWIMPVQRIPRYALLMNELLKNTPEKHEDYPFIKQALSKFQEIAEYINHGKKLYDSQEKVAMIQQRMNPKAIPVIRERRTWVSEGIVYMKNGLFIPPKKPITVKKGKPEPTPEVIGLQEVEFFLMNDLIMWAVKDPKHGYLNDLGRIPLHELITCDERPAYQVPFYDNTGMYKAFTIRTQDHTEESAPIFYCSDPSTCDKWISTIKETFQKTAKERASELERLANGKLSSPSPTL